MIARLLITGLVLAAGFILYQRYSHTHLQRVAQLGSIDPILASTILGIPTIVYFTTPTCIPCRTRQQPALEQLQTELGVNGVQVIKVDATENPSAADRWGVLSAPTTFILDENGQPRDVNYGVADIQKLKRQIEQFSIANFVGDRTTRSKYSREK